MASRGRKTQKLRTKTTNSDEETDLLIQDDAEYADDATLFVETDDREQMCERVGNYDIATETREIKIQFDNVLLLIHAWWRTEERTPTAIRPDKIHHMMDNTRQINIHGRGP